LIVESRFASDAFIILHFDIQGPLSPAAATLPSHRAFSKSDAKDFAIEVHRKLTENGIPKGEKNLDRKNPAGFSVGCCTRNWEKADSAHCAAGVAPGSAQQKGMAFPSELCFLVQGLLPLKVVSMASRGIPLRWIAGLFYFEP
jgi:hypothetical protein